MRQHFSYRALMSFSKLLLTNKKMIIITFNHTTTITLHFIFSLVRDEILLTKCCFTFNVLTNLVSVSFDIFFQYGIAKYNSNNRKTYSTYLPQKIQLCLL